MSLIRTAALAPAIAPIPRWTLFADDSGGDEFVIPEDVAALSDDDLLALHSQATENFDAVYGDGKGLSEEAMSALSVLTEGIERLAAEQVTREASAAERDLAAADLAKRVKGEQSSDVPDEDEPDEDDEDEDADADADLSADDDVSTVPAGEVVVASAPREIRVNLGSLARKTPKAVKPIGEASSMRDVVLASGDGTGYAPGAGLDWADVGRIVDRRLTGFQEQPYAAARARGQHLRQQFSVATIHKPFTEDLMVRSNDPLHVDEVIRHAMDESRLPGGSLVASGGWCAPSETVYDLCELESRDGLFSLPEIGISRGGIQFTQGPNFADLYANTGFCYTEAEDVAGDYDGAGGGSKPCYDVSCPDFEEERLSLCGVCISAGLLKSRGYPELIARTTRGSLVAHDHRLSGNVLASVVTGSTAVTMTAGQVGAAAPLLEAIEMQVEHFRYVNRLARSVTLEAVFPFWVRGVVRADLSRRQGIDLLSVTDAQIDGWFRLRGIAAQFVYNWQDLTGPASSFKAWPATVSFLLYAAGTWVKGASDIITLDTIYDSTGLANNEYTALFTEEGWLTMKTCHDSRVITVALCADGMTGAGVELECNGTATPATP